ncbi:MAG: ABC transporter permease [bacterium]|jgi:sodium transport system permease protein
MLSRVPAIYRKEMLDLIRDRRAIVSMVVVPVLAMPLLFFVLGKIVTRVEQKATADANIVAVRNLERLPGLLNALVGYNFEVKMHDDPRAAVENKEVPAALEPVETSEGITLTLYIDDSRPESSAAGDKLKETLDAFRTDTVKLRLRSYGVPEAVLSPFSIKRENVAPKQRMAGFMWGGILGYLVVLLMFTGGMYPAIDATAGEKERRTLEVVLSSPAGRNELILGKILATTTAVFATAVLTVSSLLVSFRYVEFGSETQKLRETLGNLPIDVHTMGLVLVALLPTAIMGASIMIAVALFAKSFKEAQSYLTPLLSAIIFPLIVGMMPGVTLTPASALIPLFNVCQLVKQIIQGEYAASNFAIVMAANAIYAVVAFFAAVRVFNDEKVLFRT